MEREEKMVSSMFPEYILKYGTIGVMAVWLFTLNTRMKDVEDKLYDCMEKRVEKRATISSTTPTKQPVKIIPIEQPGRIVKELIPMICVRPEELIIKKI